MSAVLSDADIHARLAEAVLDQRLAPGQRLREEGLAGAGGAE